MAKHRIKQLRLASWIWEIEEELKNADADTKEVLLARLDLLKELEFNLEEKCLDKINNND